MKYAWVVSLVSDLPVFTLKKNNFIFKFRQPWLVKEFAIE